ncbi:hypothetical protein GCM10017559_63390 [Streptosporangium longisporum]|uniref:Uncharacterized protein n=1 Tax=Streptosporangium longisporum TaxID=46187 RepID=A0ABP6KZW3_9ACTN
MAVPEGVNALPLRHAPPARPVGRSLHTPPLTTRSSERRRLIPMYAIPGRFPAPEAPDALDAPDTPVRSR